MPVSVYTAAMHSVPAGIKHGVPNGTVHVQVQVQALRRRYRGQELCGQWNVTLNYGTPATTSLSFGK